MSRGELFALMSCGMAGVAGTMMVLYAAIRAAPRPAGRPGIAILVASVISTPAALAVAALMVPFAPRAGEAAALDHVRPASALDAITRGTAEGVAPLVGIATTLLVTVALVALANAALTLIPHGAQAPWNPHGAQAPWSLQGALGQALRPVMWLIGVPWEQTEAAGLLMGTKMILNELVAYLRLSGADGAALSPHTRRIMVAALCGFANLGSAGILAGGMTAMVPHRRGEIATLALRSIVSGTIATCLSGAWVGLLT